MKKIFKSILALCCAFFAGFFCVTSASAMPSVRGNGSKFIMEFYSEKDYREVMEILYRIQCDINDRTFFEPSVYFGTGFRPYESIWMQLRLVAREEVGLLLYDDEFCPPPLILDNGTEIRSNGELVSYSKIITNLILAGCDESGIHMIQVSPRNSSVLSSIREIGEEIFYSFTMNDRNYAAIAGRKDSISNNWVFTVTPHRGVALKFLG